MVRYLVKVEKLPSVKKPKEMKLPWKTDFKRNWVVYMVFLPVFIYIFVTNYLPMFGIAMAFQDFRITRGFLGSEWVGLGNFFELFSADAFPNALRNTMIMAAFNIVLGFPAPIIFALVLTSVKIKPFRRACQTISYLPNFVAAVVVVTLIRQFLSPTGAITELLEFFGLPAQNWLVNPNPPVFWLINSLSGVWQGFGYGSIIYIAAITNINGEYYEAAAIDGANGWQRIWKITIPSIMPMIVMMLILQFGIVMRIGFDRILLMYVPRTFEVADNLFTFTYRMAFGAAPNFGLSAASGLFQSVLSTALLVLSNQLAKSRTQMSLF